MGTAADRLDAPPSPAAPPTPPTARSRRWRTVAAGLALLTAYVALSFLNDPGGTLGTDTGGKVATLEVMVERGTADPDVGYWAERFDPTGRLHPLWYTSRLGNRWVNVTTLPMIEAAAPLYRLGGYRLALLLPMLGGVAAAFAARALARRLVEGAGRDRAGWSAFWLVGLASPVTIYALDLWEHALGLALLAWAAVALMDVVEGRRGTAWLAWGGLAVGLAATMRTEALAYGAVWAAIAGVVLLWRRTPLMRVAVGGAASGGTTLAALAANAGLEQVVLGQSLRFDRAVSTVTGAGAGGASRTTEALVTLLSPFATTEAFGWLAGLVLVGLLAVVALRSYPGGPAGGLSPLLVAGVCGVYAVRLATGLDFVPGLLAATPLAAVGLVRGWGSPARLLTLFALLPLPVVWRFEFTGGAAPQWGGRYILTSGLLLGVVGIVALPRLVPAARALVVGSAVAVTALGLAWLSVRSNAVARFNEGLTEMDAPVIVSAEPHLAREMGARYPQQRWLTARGPDALAAAADVVRQAGEDRFVVVSREDEPTIRGWQVTGRNSVTLFAGVPMQVTSFGRGR